MGKIRAVAGASGGEGSIQILVDMPSEGADAASVAAHFNGNGGVGIGTDSPNDKFQVDGRVRINAPDNGLSCNDFYITYVWVRRQRRRNRNKR